MASVPDEMTASAGSVLTAAEWNTNVRDAINFILAPPLFVGRQTVAQAVSSASWQTMDIDTEDIDRDNGHSTVTGPSQYVAQTGGWYSVSGSCDFNSNAVGFRAFAFLVNSTTRSRRQQWGLASGTDTGGSTAGILYLNAGDYIEYNIWQSSGGSLNTNSGTGEAQGVLQALWVSQ